MRLVICRQGSLVVPAVTGGLFGHTAQCPFNHKVNIVLLVKEIELKDGFTEPLLLGRERNRHRTLAPTRDPVRITLELGRKRAIFRENKQQTSLDTKLDSPDCWII